MSDMVNGDGVRISNRDIWDELRAQGRSSHEKLEALSKRVGRLEIAFFGILAAIGTALGALAGGGKLP